MLDGRFRQGYFPTLLENQVAPLLLHEDGLMGRLLAKLRFLVGDGFRMVTVAVDDAPGQELTPGTGRRIAP